jgi:hypothetical protein
MENKLKSILDKIQTLEKEMIGCGVIREDGYYTEKLNHIKLLLNKIITQNNKIDTGAGFQGNGHGEDDCPAKPLEEPKQETLEEAAENYSKNFDYAEDSSPQIDFVEGAKWQAERMYNDIKLFTEELKDKIDSFEYSVNQNSYILDYIEEWFEQFKK